MKLMQRLWAKGRWGVRRPDGTFKIEVSYAGTGSFKGVGVTEIWTFLDTHRPDGVIQGVEIGDLTRKVTKSNVRATQAEVLTHNSYPERG